MMRYETMKSSLLPAALLINDFVKGIGPYTYEQYLIEIVNATPYFLRRSQGQFYFHPPEEDHGEWDCVSSRYAMDFKLAASESHLRALSLFSSQIYVGNGWISYCAPKIGRGDKRYKPITATRLFAALRALSLEELKEIRQLSTAKGLVNRDVRHLLESLETDKNLFLFFPYNIYFDEGGRFEDGLSIALPAIGADFQNSLLYRAECCPDRDTYFCFIYARHFVISAWQGHSLRLLDAIPVEKSPLFMKLLYYAESEFDREVLQ